MAAISRAAVHEWVRRAVWLPTRSSSQAQQRFEKAPLPARCPFACACAMYVSSRPVMYGLLNGIIVGPRARSTPSASAKVIWADPK